MVLKIFDFSSANFDRFIITAALFLAGISILWFLVRKLRQEIKATPGSDKSYRVMRKALLPFTLFIVLLALKMNLNLIVTDEKVLSVGHDTLTISIIAIIAWMSINAVKLTRYFLLKRFDMSQKDNLRARKIYTQFRILERIIIFIIIFLAIAFALMTFDSIRQLGVSLFASAGIAGVILGLAAQKVIGSMLAGFQIAITQPIRLDDVVIVEGEWGWIEEITLTYVVVKIWDLRRLVVPTTFFIEKPFQSWTRNSSDILGTVFIHTDYTMPVDELRNEFQAILKTTDLWDGNISNVQVVNTNDKTMEIRMLMSAVDSPTAWDLRVFVRENLIKWLQNNHSDKLPRTRVVLPDTKD
jgi:small-conductance mechanosensitive channel